jgi:Fe-S cluster biogenesis protein NfuA
VASTDLDAAGLANRIEELLDGIAETGGPQVAHAAEELVRVLMRFYGAGLEQVVSVVRAGGGDAMVHRLAADPLVGGLLALHDLHPVELRPRVEHALSTAKRKLGSHGGDVELLGIDVDTTVRVALGASGCGAATVREVVTDEVTAAAPDSAGVAVVEAESGPTLLQIGSRTGS